MAEVVLKARKARPFFGHHPWVMSSAVDHIRGNPADGDEVDLLTDRGEWIARGIYNGKSRISVRLYSWNAGEVLDEAFWKGRLSEAIALRNDLGYNDPQGAARVVFSEADRMSGLIVDRYADHLSIQLTSQAMALRLPTITKLLTEALHPRSISVRTEKDIATSEGLAIEAGCIQGEASQGPIFITEHGVRFGVEPSEGQKTGFYLDQRENRRVAAGYMRGRSVLDLCSYSGGFSLSAAILGGAKEVLGIDTSRKAVALARANAELNGVQNVRFEEDDCFRALDRLMEEGKRFDAVILDPPKFAKSRARLDEAMRAYHRLNRVAVDLLQPRGILVTCSCSGHVSREDFFQMLMGVAQRAKRDIQVLEQRGAAADHPVSTFCRENEYLKCFICRVA